MAHTEVRNEKDRQNLRYSVRDVISFFALATGPLFESHGELAEKLHLAKQVLPDSTIDRVVSMYEAVDPLLRESVVEPMQSGDPMRAQRAIERLGADALEVDKLIQSASLVAEDGREGRGWTITTSWAVTVQVAAAAGYVVALGAAVVAGVFVLLYRPAGELTEFERELSARAVAESFDKR